MANRNARPYLIHVKENGISKVNTFYLTEDDLSSLGYEHVLKADTTQLLLEPTTQHTQPEEPRSTTPSVNYICEVIGPKELDLLPALSRTKRPHPKKKSNEKETVQIDTTSEPTQRTRSGRLVKLPKYIVKDFKKIEINDDQAKIQEKLKVPEYSKQKEVITNEIIEPKKVEHIELHQKKRKIAAQYRCPTCHKAYLGKSKMLEHLKKYPGHGPAPSNDLNFEVWNYLVCLSQKCSPSQRGTKFCEELTNLLHNLLLLNNALFKTTETLNKTKVSVDKVLGNALGLPPGSYYFDDSKLHKDVTILKLLDNEYLFKDTFVTSKKSTESSSHDQNVHINVLNNNKKDVTKKDNNQMHCNNSTKIVSDKKEVSSDTLFYPPIFNMESLVHSGFDISMTEVPAKPSQDVGATADSTFKSNNGVSNYTTNNLKLSLELSHDAMDVFDSHNKKVSFDTTNKICSFDGNKKPSFESNRVINQFVDNTRSQINGKTAVSFDDPAPLHARKNGHPGTNESIVGHPNLLSEHSLLNPLPHLRNSVDEALILTESSHLLDNSSSSDEVMNVDQFVNERFKKITEPELDLTNPSLISLDLPSLDMFEFHTN